jgi:beta-galactosidase
MIALFATISFWSLMKLATPLLSAVLFTVSSSSGTPPEESIYPIAVWYGGGKARAPMQEADAPAHRALWKKDLEQIHRLGFPAIKTWVEWASSERQEGRYNLENLDQLLDLADETGLRVIIQIYVDSAPDWVGDRYADARFVAQNGDAIPSQAAPGYCTDHPEIARLVTSFYQEVARHAVRHRSFYAYDLWSEPHIINWAVINYIPDAQFCYCKNTLAKFRRWLEAKYGGLSALNSAWYRGFERWDQVEPPRFGTILSYSDFVDWKNFISDKLADDLRVRRDAVKSVDPSHPASSHAAVPAILTSPFAGDGTPDDWKMAASADYYGTSIYPKHSSSAAPWTTLRRAGSLDFIRSSGRRHSGFYIGELQAGFGTTGVKVGEPVTSEDIEDWTWAAVARGARSISYYAYYPMSSGYESGGYGLIELDGTLTPRSRRAGSIAALLNRHADFFLKANPVAAEAAILYNPSAHLVGGEQSGGIRGGVRDSLFGYYRSFFERNVPVDFVHVMDLEKGDWGKYNLLIVPYAVMLSTRAAEEIRRFVASGGYVLAEARTAWNNERGWATDIIPGGGLDETFGCRESEVRPRAKSTLRLNSLLAQSADGQVPAFAETAGAVYEEVLRVSSPSAKVVGTFGDGSPALVLNRSGSGKGETLFAGTFLGAANEAQPSEGFRQLMDQILEWARVKAPVSIEPASAGSEVRLMEGEGGALVLIFNREESEKSLHLRLNRAEKVRSLEPWTEQTPAEALDSGREVVVRVPAHRVAAVFLKYR